LLALEILERLDLGPRCDHGAPEVEQVEEVLHLHAAAVGQRNGEQRSAAADLELARVELGGIGVGRALLERDVEAVRLVELFRLDHRRHEGAERRGAEDHDRQFFERLRLCAGAPRRCAHHDGKREHQRYPIKQICDHSPPPPQSR
jgi:hypothetical protein